MPDRSLPDSRRKSSFIQPFGHVTDRQVLGYVRVSTEKQAEGGISLAAQTTKIRAMAEVKGVEVTEILVEAAASARSLDRPEMLRLLAQVDAGAVGTVIIAKLDRLTRSVVDLADLLARFERQGVALVSVSESLDTRSSAGRLLLNIMTSVSQWEREAIGERTRDALQEKKAKGERVGTLPFGSQLAADGIHLEPAPVEQRLRDHIRAMKATCRTTKEIAATLNAEGSRTRRGTPWRYQYVARVLKCG